MTSQNSPESVGDEVVPGDALALAEELGKALRRINDLFAFRRFIRRIILALTVTFVADLAITLSLAFFFSSLHHAQVTACEIGNESRHDQVILWNGIVNKFTPRNPTPEQKKNDRELISFVGNTFHQVDCHKLYG